MIEDLEKITQREIDSILEGMKWEKIHAYMTITNWQWQMDMELRVPTLKEVKAHGELCLHNAIQLGRQTNKATSTGNGGFVASYNIYSNKECLRLVFALSQWSNY
jgi:hypothetical protein